MDEIICSACGRPNLAEAEKCWYCQAALAQNEGAPLPTEEELPIGQETPAAPPSPEQLSAKNNPTENIPDWLRRIRELKEADQPIEEIDQWQQEKLFAGNPDEKSRPAKRPEDRAANQVEKTSPEAAKLQGQPLFEETLENESHAVQEERAAEADEDGSEDGLPDGFTPFENGR